MNHRFELLALAVFCGGLACGVSDSEVEPGRETGSCVEFECLGDLVCLSNLCVDPFATPTDGDDTTHGMDGEDETGGPPSQPDSVSILVVADNSGSMGEAQQAVASALSGLPGALDAAGIDWRIGITTTDDGNPWCQGTGPEAGNLVFSSCCSRLDGFVFEGVQTIDASEACTEICPEEWSMIESEPSSIEDGGEAAPRPWVQSIGGETNLPAGLSPADAMNCLVPQGINGCGFEQPLESMHKAIERSVLDTDNAYGFLPQGALLAVLIVSDEADCSFNDGHVTIFLPDGDKVFWSDPTTPGPSSAVCWNAATQCTGDSCVSANFDALGSPVPPEAADEAAVMLPVRRYTGRLGEIDRALVMLIGGTQADGSVVYQDSTDPLFQADFGIGPGCSGPGGSAVPPVRMREVAAEFSDGGQNMFSICEANHGPAIEALVASIANRLQ